MRQAEIHTTTFKGQWQRPQDDKKMVDRWPFKHSYESSEDYEHRMEAMKAYASKDTKG